MTATVWNPCDIAATVHLEADGIWYGESAGELAYPADGHSTTRDLEARSFWYRHRLECIAALLQAFPPARELFDIGGGNGYLAKGLQDKGYPTVLVEPGRVGARNARERGVRNVICATVESAGIQPGTLAAAGMFDVLEHIPDDLAFLTRLRDRMEAGGRLYLTIPAYPWLWSAHDDYMHHCRRYTRRSLTATLRQAGFRVEYVSYFFLFLTLPVFVLRALPTRLGLRKHSQASRAKDHVKEGRLSGRLLKRMSCWEAAKVANAQRLPFGASLLAVAAKVDSGEGG